MGSAPKLREKLRSVGGVTVGRVIGNASEFAAMALAARVLGPAEFGKLTYTLAVALISSQFFDLGAARILTIRASLLIGSRAKPENVGNVYGSLLSLRLAVGVVVLPLLVWMGLGARSSYFAAGVGLGFLMSVVLCASAIFQSELEFGKYASSVWLPGALRALGVILLAVFGRASVPNLIVYYLAAHVLTVLVFLSLLPWRGIHLRNPAHTAGELLQLFHFGKWLIAAAIFEVAYARTDVLALRFLGTPRELGIYGAAFVFAGVFSLLHISVVAYYIPMMCRSSGEGRSDRLKEYYLESADLLALIGLPAAIGIWAIGPTLFPLVFGEQYQASASVWPVLAIYSVCLMLNQTGTVFFALEKLHIITLVTAGILVTNLLLCFLLVPRYGALGAAWTVAIGQISSLIFCWAVTYRLIGVIPNLVRIGYYLGCSLILFPIVRSVSIPMPRLSLGIKIFVGIAVYAGLLGLARKVVKGHPLLTAGRTEYGD
jgi:O-antigen/teichoic acid export membrane protein